MTSTQLDVDRLRDKLRSARWMAVIALGFGLGIGLYAGFTLGVKTAHEVDAVMSATTP